MRDSIRCKTRYSTFRTVLDQIGAHGLNTVTWRWASPSSPTPSACRFAVSGLDCATAPGKGRLLPWLPENWRLLSLVSKCTDAVREIEYWFSQLRRIAMEFRTKFQYSTSAPMVFEAARSGGSISSTALLSSFGDYVGEYPLPPKRDCFVGNCRAQFFPVSIA